MHYFEDMSLRECGEAIGVSESRAFQLRAQALGATERSAGWSRGALL